MTSFYDETASRWRGRELTEVNGQVEANLAVLCALRLTPDTPSEEYAWQQEIHREVRDFFAPSQPRVVVLGCGAGGALLVHESYFDAIVEIGSDSKSLERARSNSWRGSTELVPVQALLT